LSASEHLHPDPRAWERWETPPGVPDRALLELLAADAAERAAAMLAGDAAPAQAGTAPQLQNPLVDAVRLLATTAGARQVEAAARLTGVPEDELRRLVLAYRHGGPGGVAAALAPAPCGTEDMAAAVDEVRKRRGLAVDELSVDEGAITDARVGVRLRRGPDGRWYPFTLARGQWWPALGANASAGAAYQSAVRARSARRANG
jgi:hypothetical protein